MDIYEKIDYSNHIPYIIELNFIEDKKKYIASHWHNSLEIIFPIFGTVKINDNGNIVNVSDPDFYIINSRHVHSFHMGEGKETYLGGCLRIDYEFLKGLTKKIEEIEFVQIESKQVMSYCRKLLFEMFRENEKNLPFKNVYVESQLLLLLYHLFKYIKVGKPYLLSEDKQNKRIADIVKYIEDNYKEDLSIEMIANHFGLSSGYLTKQFKDRLGKAPKEYLLSYRLKMAERDLIESDDAIIDIAWNHGFASINSFYSQFKKKYGVSPARYRKLQEEKMDADFFVTETDRKKR